MGGPVIGKQRARIRLYNVGKAYVEKVADLCVTN